MLGLGTAAVLWLLAMQMEEGGTPASEAESPATTRSFDGGFFRALPLIGHRYQDMLAMAPGVSDPDGDGRLNVHGSREGGVAWRLDGAEVTDPRTADTALALDPAVVGRMDIVTAGADASFGRALGGFADIVTRGGSNDLSGAITSYWGGRFLDGDGAGNEDIVHYDAPPREFHDARISGSLGGALLRDRLWVFGAVERIETAEAAMAIENAPVVTSSGTLTFARLTWQPDASSTLTLQTAADPLRHEGLGLDFSTSPESGYDLDGSTRTTRLGWKFVASGNMMLETSLSRVSIDQEIDPASDRFQPVEIALRSSPYGELQALYPCEQVNCSEQLGEDRIYRLDAFTGYVSGPWYYASRDERRRDALKTDLTAVLQPRHGTHHLHGGFEVGREDSRLDLTINPVLYDATRPAYSQDPNAHPVSGFQVLQVFTPGAVPHDIEDSYGALYLSDAFKPRPNLSVTAGVRLDGEEMGFPGYESFDPGRERRRSVELWRTVCEEAALQIPLSTTSNCYPANPYDGRPPSGIWSGLQTFVDRDGDGDNDVPASVVALDLNHDGLFETGGLEGAALFKYFTSLSDRMPGRYSLDAAHLSPRLGVSWDPSGGGHWKLFGTWGRYHDRLRAEAVLDEAAGESRSFTFLPDGTRTIRPGAPSRTAPTASIFQVDHDLEPARMDELSLGAECALTSVWRVGLTYVHRETEGVLQTVDLNHYTCPQAGSAIGIDPHVICGDPNGRLNTDRFGQYGYSYPETFGMPNGLEDLYALSEEFNQVLRVEAMDRLEDDSWELSLVRALHHNWQLQAGYTFSRARGESSEAFSSARDDASVVPSARSPLDHDERHSLEFQATGRLPRDVTLGGAIRWDSGIPYTVLGAAQIDYDSSGNSVARVILPTGDVNDQRNEGRWRVDARMEKGFRIRNVHASAFLTVRNLLNDDSLTIVGYTPGGFVDGYREFGRRFEIGGTLSF